MKVAAYLRARDPQDPEREQKLLDVQRADINNWVSNQGHKLVVRFEDIGYSANDPMRPAYCALVYIATLASPGFDVIVVHSPDRIYRNVEICLTLRRLLKESGIKLLFVNEYQNIS